AKARAGAEAETGGQFGRRPLELNRWRHQPWRTDGRHADDRDPAPVGAQATRNVERFDSGFRSQKIAQYQGCSGIRDARPHYIQGRARSWTEV
ncbi:hypothetical protein AB0877_10670, partial [Micromonospora sp. NPDC047644]|uniref:hypothetical protein n=1 Tax=Micromonospora sp. NPDC047644 TaxID=3157203 RepID=UPI003454C4C5